MWATILAGEIGSSNQWDLPPRRSRAPLRAATTKIGHCISSEMAAALPGCRRAGRLNFGLNTEHGARYAGHRLADMASVARSRWSVQGFASSRRPAKLSSILMERYLEACDAAFESLSSTARIHAAARPRNRAWC